MVSDWVNPAKALISTTLLIRASSSMAEQRTLNPQVLGSSPRGRTRSEGVTALQLLARSAILGPSAKQSLLRKRNDRGTCSFSSRERREGFCWLPCPCRSYFHPQRRSAKQCESPSLPAPGTHGAASNRSPVRCSVPSAPRSPK